MQFNLNTTITAFPKLSPSILNNYVQEAPTDGKTYARKDGKWVDIISNVVDLRYGISPFNVLVDNTDNSINSTELVPDKHSRITDLQNHVELALTNRTEISVTTPSCGGYCWICCTFPLNSICDKTTGWALDYFKQKDNLTVLNADGTTTTYYCYCIRDELMGNETFKFTIDIQEGKF